MRLIGHLTDEAGAVAFGDYLLVNGIKNQIESEKAGSWAVWVHCDDDLPRAKDFLGQYLANPNDAKYREAGRQARQLTEDEKQDSDAYRKRLHTARQIWPSFLLGGLGPVTLILIAISIGVAIYSKMPLSFMGWPEREPIKNLFITTPQVIDNYLMWHKGLPEIRAGQIWRLITPIFIHANLLHILFNLLWLRDLGTMIERCQTSWHLLVLVLLTAALSNLGQYMVSGPDFGGMSGVVYGLLGYVWIRGKFDPGSGLFLHRETVIMMIAWLVLCYTGALGPIANTAHVVGLVSGMAAGFISGRFASR
jgi:rhomboid protease GlpG